MRQRRDLYWRRPERRQVKPGNFQDTGYKKDIFYEGYPRQKEVRRQKITSI